MSEKLDLIAIIGEYTTAQGETKKKFTKIGTLFNKPNGISIKLDAVPVGGWDGWASAKEPLPRGEAPARQSSQPTRRGGNGFEDMQDDVPF